MFDNLYTDIRVPSAQSAQARKAHLDSILGKLPHIDENKSASRGGQDQISDGSTTAMSSSSKAIKEAENEVKKEHEEESYWQWKSKQLDYLKLPVYAPPSRSARNKKILPPIGNLTMPEIPKDGLVYVKALLEDQAPDDQTDQDPLSKLSKKQKKDDLERKDRWVKKFETESREVNERSVSALNQA